jgi:hypothetical protein
VRVLLLAAIPILAAGADETAERNKAGARRFFEQGWFVGKPEAVGDLIAGSVKVHDPREAKSVVNETASRQLETLSQWCGVNGDCTQSEIRFQIAEGDRVLTYWVFRQTPKRLLGGIVQRLFGRVPSERRMATVFRFEQGRIVEIWGMRDDLGLYSDLGLLNLTIVAIFALGGAFGMIVMWVLWRMTRRSVESR